MDIAMPLLNGLEAAGQIARRDKRVGIVILSMYSDEEYLVRAVMAGVRSYLLKDSAEPDLIRAVHAVASGKTFFSPRSPTCYRMITWFGSGSRDFSIPSIS